MVSILLIYYAVSRFSFLVSWWRCDRYVRFLVSRFSFLGGSVTGPLALGYVYKYRMLFCWQFGVLHMYAAAELPEYQRDNLHFMISGRVSASYLI